MLFCFKMHMFYRQIKDVFHLFKSANNNLNGSNKKRK